MTPAEYRQKILALVVDYHAAAWPERPFVPGESFVPVSGRVFDAEDIQYLVDASLDFWLTTGRFAAAFEAEFAQRMGTRHCSLVNSGSSANLLALTALTADDLGDRRLVPGDEVITCATGFPTTVNPILQNQLVPVFLDARLPSCNLDTTRLEEAVGPRTKAIFVAHALGNPFDVDAVMDVARRHRLWVIEDCCDAVGAAYNGQSVGTFGHLSTVSFYPAHHLTMGEGGAVLTSDPQLKRLVESFRDWGRDCWCEPGHDNTCRRRFDWKLGELPKGYDHKYIYSHMGYNLKATDMQAAVGVAQLKKLSQFVERRRANHAHLRERLRDLEGDLMLPEPTPGSDPSWFGFLLTLRPEAPFDRTDLLRHLDRHRIGTRLLFGGNLLRQPYLKNVPCRVVGSLEVADQIMERTFWIGIYPGLTREMLDYAADRIADFFRQVA